MGIFEVKNEDTRTLSGAPVPCSAFYAVKVQKHSLKSVL